MRRLALLPLLVGGCTIHVHVHPPEPTRSASATRPPSPASQVVATVRGTVVDAGHAPIEAHVTLAALRRGSSSTGTDADGRFELTAFDTQGLVLHATDSDHRVAIRPVHSGDGDVVLVLQPGAVLLLEHDASDDVRCSLEHAGAWFEDFTLRAGERARVTVPAGRIRVRLYDGERVHVERTVEVGAGDRAEVRLAI